jgi:pyridoxamine 5'-phosphate oxidase
MTTLENIQQSVWQHLREAQTDFNHPFRLGILATAGKKGANLRTVVVRKVVPEQGMLWFYTDYRSPKVQELQNNHNVSWLFYDATEKVQVRLYGHAEILHDTATNHYVWQNLPDYGKADYLTQQAPGEVKNAAFPNNNANDDANNFCIIKTTIHTIDWLKLSRDGHLRAKFALENRDWKSEWLVP